MRTLDTFTSSTTLAQTIYDICDAEGINISNVERLLHKSFFDLNEMSSLESFEVISKLYIENKLSVWGITPKQRNAIESYIRNVLYTKAKVLREKRAGIHSDTEQPLEMLPNPFGNGGGVSRKVTYKELREMSQQDFEDIRRAFSHERTGNI